MQVHRAARIWVSRVVAVFHQLRSEPALLRRVQPVEPLSPDTLFPPLNDFSSSSASHLIKVESLMPFRNPTAFSCIGCHYENEWWQLRTQMFFHIITECLLMCLMIFTVAA